MERVILMEKERKNLQNMLDKHKKWLDGNGGECMSLHDASLRGAHLNGIDLRGAKLSGADLSYADLRGANLSGADLEFAKLRYTDLVRANLYHVSFSGANLVGAYLNDTNLQDANLSYANLSDAKLNCANLDNVNWRYANLHDTNLSGAKNLLSTVDFLENNFEKTKDGYIAYKCFNGAYPKNEDWEIKSGSVINENVNPNRTDECGCGINVATIDWVHRTYPYRTIWRVLIRWEWLCGVCVPYNTDGKIRCERVELIDFINEW